MKHEFPIINLYFFSSNYAYYDQWSRTQNHI